MLGYIVANIYKYFQYKNIYLEKIRFIITCYYNLQQIIYQIDMCTLHLIVMFIFIVVIIQLKIY